MLESLAQERQGQFVLARINTDECPGLAASFQIQAIPAVKGIRNGELVLEFEGVLPESDLRQFLDRIGPSEAENLAQQARARETTILKRPRRCTGVSWKATGPPPLPCSAWPGCCWHTGRTRR